MIDATVVAQALMEQKSFKLGKKVCAEGEEYCGYVVLENPAGEQFVSPMYLGIFAVHPLYINSSGQVCVSPHACDGWIKTDRWSAHRAVKLYNEFHKRHDHFSHIKIIDMVRLTEKQALAS